MGIQVNPAKVKTDLEKKQAAIEERINSDELLSMLIDDAAQLIGMSRAAYVANLKGRVQG